MAAHIAAHMWVNEARYVPLSLLDSSASVIAKTRSCDDLEKETRNFSLPEHLIKMITFWAFPQSAYKEVTVASVLISKISPSDIANVCKEYMKDNAIEARQIGFMLAVRYKKKIGHYEDDSSSLNLNYRAEGEIHVSVSFEQQQLSHATCSECINRHLCHHVLCAIFYRIKHAEQVPIHMPLTESLESLTKVQLQYLVHQAVLKNPGLHLRALFDKYDEARAFRAVTASDATDRLEDMTYGYAGTDTYFSQKLDETRIHYVNYLNSLDDCDDEDDTDYIFDFDPGFDDFIILAMRSYYPDQLQHFADMLKMMTTEAIQHTLEYPSIFVVEHRARRLLRFLSLLVMWPAAAPIREQILDHVRHCSQWLSASDVKRLDLMKWVELPSLSDSHDPQVLQPLVAAQYLHWPTKLEDLLKLKGTDVIEMQEFVKNSSYDEDLAVMVARYEAIKTFAHYPNSPNGIMENESFPLGLKILQKATNIMIQDSVLGAYLALPRTDETASVQDNIVRVFNIEENTLRKLKQVYAHLGDSELGTANGRQRMSDSPVETAAKQSTASDDWAEVMENTIPDYKQANIYTGDTSVASLTKHQVVFVMSEICHWLWESSEELADAVLPYVQLAFELSRSFTVTNNHVSNKREKCIALQHAYENTYIDEFRLGSDVLRDEYMKAFQKFGASCYDGEQPFFLLYNIFCGFTLKSAIETMTILSTQTKNDIVRLAADFILDSPDPFAKFVRDVCESECGICLNAIVSAFFDNINLDDASHCLLVEKVLRHLADMEPINLFKLMEIVDEFEQQLPVFHHLRCDVLVFWMCRGSRAESSTSNEEQKLVQLMNTIQADVMQNLDTFSHHYQYNLGIGLLEAALDVFEPLAEQHQKDKKSLPPGYVSLIMFYINGRVLSVVSEELNKTVVYLGMLVDDQENFTKACRKVRAGAGHFTMAQLFEVAKLQQPESSVAKFKPETLAIIHMVLTRENLDWTFGKLSEPVKQLVLWALKLSTTEAATATVNAALRQLIVLVEAQSIKSTAILELVLSHLEHQNHTSDLLLHAARLSANLVTLYKMSLSHFIIAYNRDREEELERYMKNMLTSCQRYSPTGLADILSVFDQIRLCHFGGSLQAIVDRVALFANYVRINIPCVFKD